MLTGTESTGDLIPVMKGLLESEHLVRALQKILATEDPQEILTTVSQVGETDRFLVRELKSSSIAVVKGFVRASREIERRQQRIMNLLSLDSPAEIESVIEANRDADAELTSVRQSLRLGISQTRVADLIAAEQVCEAVIAALEAADRSQVLELLDDLLRSNAEMRVVEEQMMVTLGVIVPDSIPAKLSAVTEKMANQSALIDSIAETARITDPEKVPSEIKRLLRAEKEFERAKIVIGSENLVSTVKEVQAELEDCRHVLTEAAIALNVPRFADIKGILGSLLRAKETLSRWSSDGNPEAGLQRLLDRLESQRQRMIALANQLGCAKTRDVESAVGDLQNHLSISSRLFSKLFSICSSSNAVVQFPIEPEYEKRLDRLIDEFKVRRQTETAQLDLVMTKARSFGYSGCDLNEAVDLMVGLITDEAHHTLSEQQHEDIMAMRAVHELERSVLGKQLHRAQKTIDSLRLQVTQGSDDRFESHLTLTEEDRTLVEQG
jgi:hypothetical protein